MNRNARLQQLERERRSPPPVAATVFDPDPAFARLMVEVERDEVEERIEAEKGQVTPRAPPPHSTG